MYDVYVYELGANDYEAVDSSGTTIDSGSNGMAVFQSGISACPVGGRIYAEGEYTYSNTSDQLSIDSGKRLVGYGCTIYNETGTDTAVIEIVGSRESGDDTTLAQSANEDDNSVIVSDSSGYSVGDTVVVLNDNILSVDDSTRNEGELHYIIEVDGASDMLRFDDPLYFDHTTADNGRVKRIDAETAYIEGVTIEGSGATVNELGISLRYTAKCVIEDVDLSKMGYRLIDCINTYGTVVRHSDLRESDVNGDGYGIRMRNGCTKSIIHDNQFTRCRHCVAHSATGDDGLQRDTYITDNVFTGTMNGSTLDSHDAVLSWYIINNHLTSSPGSAAITNGAKETYVFGNANTGVVSEEDRGGFYRSRDSIFNGERRLVIQDNSIKRSGRLNVIDLRAGAGRDYDTVRIDGNDFLECRENIVRFSTNIDSFIFDNNTLTACESAILRFDESTSVDLNSGSICGNTMNNCGTPFVVVGSFGTLANIDMSHNTFLKPRDQSSGGLILFDNLENSVISNNTIQDPNGNVSTAISLDTGTSGNLVRDNNVRHTGSTTVYSDSGTDNTDFDNYESSGSGWSEVT